MTDYRDHGDEVVVITIEEWWALITKIGEVGPLGDLARRAWEADPFRQRNEDEVSR